MCLYVTHVWQIFKRYRRYSNHTCVTHVRPKDTCVSERHICVTIQVCQFATHMCLYVTHVWQIFKRYRRYSNHTCVTHVRPKDTCVSERHICVTIQVCQFATHMCLYVTHVWQILKFATDISTVLLSHMCVSKTHMCDFLENRYTPVSNCNR